MFEDDGEPLFPRKWLDRKQYVRSDPATGLPVLVQINPHMTEFDQFVPDVVEIIIDDGPTMLMGREDAEMYVTTTGCVPMEIVGKYKQGSIPDEAHLGACVSIVEHGSRHLQGVQTLRLHSAGGWGEQGQRV